MAGRRCVLSCHLSLVICHFRLQRRTLKLLADPNDKVAENVGGEFYVDAQCIDCDVCRDTAPDNFTRSDSNGYSFVYKQPGN
ncbi:MAG: ferredoxin, partial [Pyrinomonadaceae bacterium]